METRSTQLKELLTGRGGGARLHSQCSGPGKDVLELIPASKLVLEFHRLMIIIIDNSMLYNAS